MDPFFAEHGWMIVRGAVGKERLAALEAAFDSLFPAIQPGTRVVEVIGASRVSPPIAEHAIDPAIAAHVARALGCRRVQLLQDTAMLKPPDGGGRVEWHQDHTYTGFLEPAAAVSVRLALGECTVENGCMNVLDGSHRWGLVGERQILSAESVRDGLPRELREKAIVKAVELRPGDLSIHHCLTFHGSGENGSARPRKTLIVRMFDADCRLVQERLPNASIRSHFPTVDGDHLDPRAFPIVFGA